MFSEQDHLRIDRIFSHVEPGTPLEKGSLIEAFEYNSSFKIIKDGKYIKEKLKQQTATLDSEISSIQEELNKIISSLPQGISPTEEPSSYVFEGIRKSAFDSYPKLYSYESKEQYLPQKNYEEAYPTMTSINDAQNTPKAPSTYQLLCRYNEIARGLIRTKADKIWVETLIETIKDTQQIELNGRMLKLLI